jgi:hypothetical protein
MSEPDDLPPESAAPPRRRWGCLIASVTVAAALLLGTYIYLGARGEKALRDAVAETDQLDPDWRLADLEAKRARPSDPDNSAFQVQAVRRLLSQGWSESAKPDGPFRDPVPPEAQLNAPQIEVLRTELGKVARARDEARTLADMPGGYFLINWSPDAISTLMPGLQEAREVANLVHDDALLRAQEKDADGALRSVRAGVNAGRSAGDMPGAVPQLVRIACVDQSVRTLERVLAQGEPSADALEALQRLLEDEDRHPYLLVMTRGERAGMDRFASWLEENPGRLGSLGDMAGVSKEGGPLLLLRLPGEVQREHAALLRHMNEAVKVAQLPEPRQRQRLEELEAAAREQPPLVALLAPAVSKVAAATQREHALLRCAVVMLAAERYRRRQERWPESPQALVDGGLLKGVPADPYTGTPIRLKRLPDGLVIYAVGPDGVDNGGNLDRKRTAEAGTDAGVRLWDVARRRQPALPPRPKESSGGDAAAPLPDTER